MKEGIKMPEAPELDIFQKEVQEMKADQKSLEQRVSTLERTSDRHDQQIISINEKLNKIEENTTWIKRHHRRDNYSGQHRHHRRRDRCFL